MRRAISSKTWEILKGRKSIKCVSKVAGLANEAMETAEIMKAVQMEEVRLREQDKDSDAAMETAEIMKTMEMEKIRPQEQVKNSEVTMEAVAIMKTVEMVLLLEELAAESEETEDARSDYSASIPYSWVSPVVEVTQGR
jgi:ABC-type Na+ transport system ATPase subunit NatA